MNIPIQFDRSWVPAFTERIEQDGPWDNWDLFKLHIKAEQSKVIPEFDQLLCLQHLPHLEPYPHQVNTALQVLYEMRGRAILADEVGLGKTIEAGLIMKEYMVRGLAKKILILVPASLVLQWTRELNQKFGIPAVAQKKEWMWDQYDVIVASIDTAKRDPHREIVLNTYYDMLIIDEAHKLKNNRTKNWQFTNELKKKYCLLLTATPVQNDLSELFNLVTLLKPGQLGAYGSYTSDYVAGKRTPKNEELLKEEMSKIMIRNKRSDGLIDFPKRIVETIEIELSPEERALYDGVNQFVRGQYQQTLPGMQSALSLLTLQREICSSRNAAFVTMIHLYEKAEEGSPLRPYIENLVQLAREVKANTKAENVVRLIQQIQDKVIIFTE
ncbi:MAG: DEAD/DEAH box helicase, partial [Bacilli bacterium]